MILTQTIYVYVVGKKCYDFINIFYSICLVFSTWMYEITKGCCVEIVCVF